MDFSDHLQQSHRAQDCVKVEVVLLSFPDIKQHNSIQQSVCMEEKRKKGKKED